MLFFSWLKPAGVGALGTEIFFDISIFDRNKSGSYCAAIITNFAEAVKTVRTCLLPAVRKLEKFFGGKTVSAEITVFHNAHPAAAADMIVVIFDHLLLAEKVPADRTEEIFFRNAPDANLFI